jgi:hypothetical protein
MEAATFFCVLVTLSLAAAAPVPPGKVHYQWDVCGLHKSMNNVPTSALQYDKVSLNAMRSPPSRLQQLLKLQLHFQGYPPPPSTTCFLRDQAPYFQGPCTWLSHIC